MILKEILYKYKQKTKRFLKSVYQSPNHKKSNDFWIQKMPFKRIESRLNFFIKISKDKDVLHFGCTDWPIFNPKNNLHIQLSEFTNTIDGFDIDEAGIKNLKNYVNQDYFSDYNKLPTKKYDVCLIPETIEHVDNVADFLKSISKIDAKVFYITAPNCFSKSRLRNYHIKNNEFIEFVHPDHNAWFSPYTLKNQIEKYSTLSVSMVYLLEKGNMVCCKAERK